jgi:hypothetical protein
MRRINELLKTFETGLPLDRVAHRDTTDREAIIADLQARHDHLAGVPTTQRDA